MFHNCHTYSNIAHIESISPYQTPYKVVNFINLHNVNRMSNYIIHSFEEVTGYFAWLYLYHECVTILEKYMYRTDTVVGTYNYI